MRIRETPETREIRPITPRENEGRFVCFACGMVFKASKDVTYLAYDPNGGGSIKDVYMVADCPTCGAQIRMGKRLPKVTAKRPYGNDYGSKWQNEED